MDTPLEIAWHNVEKSEPLEERIRERVDKLHRYFSRINSCHVVVERPHRSQYHGKVKFCQDCGNIFQLFRSGCVG